LEGVDNYSSKYKKGDAEIWGAEAMKGRGESVGGGSTHPAKKPTKRQYSLPCPNPKSCSSEN